MRTANDTSSDSVVRFTQIVVVTPEADRYHAAEFALSNLFDSRTRAAGREGGAWNDAGLRGPRVRSSRSRSSPRSHPRIIDQVNTFDRSELVPGASTTSTGGQ
jgi:hypothetical protein